MADHLIALRRWWYRRVSSVGASGGPLAPEVSGDHGGVERVKRVLEALGEGMTLTLATWALARLGISISNSSIRFSRRSRTR